jgi:hypothetical protein
MTIDEAIKHLTNEWENNEGIDGEPVESWNRAVKLGIEALELKKRLMHLIGMGQSTEITDGLILKPLPSETED